MALVGCAAGSGNPKNNEANRYRCENNIAFTVKFADDSAEINSNRGYEVLYRNAGANAPAQTVYSNPRVRAEFGLGASGQEALLRYLLLPLVVRCVRD